MSTATITLIDFKWTFYWTQKNPTAQKCKQIIRQLTAATLDPKYFRTRIHTTQVYCKPAQ